MFKPNTVYKGVVGNAGLGKMTRDADGDKVINVLDCQPNNKNKQGFIHDLATKSGLIKNKTGESVQQEYEREQSEQRSQKYKQAAEAEIAKRSEAEYYRAKEKESARVAREKARQEANEQIKIIKSPAASKPSSFFGGVGGKLISNAPAATTYLLGGNIPSSPSMTYQIKKVVRYVKKGKTYVKKTSYVGSPVRRTVAPMNTFSNNLSQSLGVIGNSKSSGMSLVGKPSKRSNVLNLRI
jgi:hypothetical protein